MESKPLKYIHAVYMLCGSILRIYEEQLLSPGIFCSGLSFSTCCRIRQSQSRRHSSSRESG